MATSLATASGCSSAADDTAEGSAAAVTASLTPGQIAALKAQIRAIALANIDQTNNLTAVRSELDPLVAQLAASFGTPSATSTLPLVAGAWRQIWTDFPYPTVSFLQSEPTETYQVVSADGYYYNLGDEEAASFAPVTGVLRGSYTPDGRQLDVQFTKVGFRFGSLSSGESLVELATNLESGAQWYLPIPGGGAAPSGPVGISGTLETVYVDEDLRLTIGTQTAFDAPDGGVAVPGVGPKLFVLDRVTTPVAK